LSQKDKGKQIIYKIHKQKVLKSKNNRGNREVSASSTNNQKFVKLLIKEGTKILHVPNPVDPLKASDGENAIQ
jgi:hypothetical protein